jgi:5-methylcytosine-specific restriction endonuclease McrA
MEQSNMSTKEFPPDIKDKALVRQKLTCAHCGAKLQDPVFPHFKKPAELGGDNSLRNCVVLCQKCHLEYGRISRWGKFVITEDYPYFSADGMQH